MGWTNVYMMKRDGSLRRGGHHSSEEHCRQVKLGTIGVNALLDRAAWVWLCAVKSETALDIEPLDGHAERILYQKYKQEGGT